MSAYGDIKRSKASASALASLWHTVWDLSAPSSYLCIHQLTQESARAHSDLLEYMAEIFAKEVETGTTYPQEGEISLTDFISYFFSADVFVGIIGLTAGSEKDGFPSNGTLEEHKGSRSWEQCIGGFYYIKPNYPGRSSHICNAGFVVPPKLRGQGFGVALAKSYLHYAPKLGYQSSIFNLVYANNTASIRLWEKLGFTKAGLIPRAGRLRTRDGTAEEYVDAWVVYKSFIGQE
ncbi:hypothetical protein CPB83DRAFT_852025 [Crepidotus variabilis]|uniref:N-acetyltransferase domain-containing protein n=1 Tax=Crepidotus variabilis TaxID=179855 RepID=A0A9P6EJB2_9AGAR|nr:hypothetical protein CPB83DRAFT_852025 [Crepidotus variabilis]